MSNRIADACDDAGDAINRVALPVWNTIKGALYPIVNPAVRGVEYLVDTARAGLTRLGL